MGFMFKFCCPLSFGSVCFFFFLVFYSGFLHGGASSKKHLFWMTGFRRTDRQLDMNFLVVACLFVTIFCRFRATHLLATYIQTLELLTQALLQVFLSILFLLFWCQLALGCLWIGGFPLPCFPPASWVGGARWLCIFALLI